ncbi:MAG TPA: hypothetical protein P5270_09915 [Victivallales bacterium]|nr:hypothetical protein [Victivallales bacterium]
MRKVIQGKYLNKAVTVDIKTGKETPSKGSIMMLPAKEGTCEWCATAHDPDQPHNAQSLFFQYRFYNEYGKWPTWTDAMSS